MKKRIIPISALFVAGILTAQTSPSTAENYIYTKTYLSDPSLPGTAKTSETVQYFDGLGRPSQVIDIKATPSGKDLVTAIPYDQFGRQTDSWLPAPMSTLNGAIQQGSNGAAQSYYGDNIAFSHKDMEASPLGRVLSQVQPGADWQGHKIGLEYGVNDAADVKKYIATFNYSSSQSSLSVAGTYGASLLYKNTITDEDGNITIEFKSKEGQTLLVRKKLDDLLTADTYYVYNQYDQLAYVIPPKAASVFKNMNNTISIAGTDATLNELCYQYRYDGRNRLTEKKIPGKGWEYMVYDKQDRLVLVQDANIGISKQWLFTKYDALGRAAYTGIYTSSQNYGSAGRAAEQVNVDGKGNNNVVSTSAVGFSNSGIDVYYDNSSASYPINSVKILSVNYYDDYPAYSFNPTFPATILGQEVLPDVPTVDGLSTKGLPVMSLLKNIEDDNWTKNYTYYDKKGRAIGSYSINHLGGYTKTETELDFAGVPQKTNTYHLRKTGETGVTIQERFVYDSRNRLKQHFHQVDGKPEELLTENTYNELSQLSNKKVGNNLQSIDYAYNIRGWLTDINKAEMTVSNLNGKLFAYTIKYNRKEGITNPDPVLFAGKNVAVKYNGNIAEVDWRAVETLGQNPSLTPKRYGYAYDPLNRLSAGYYQNPNNPNSKENTESIDYDLNGNITKLYRTSVIEAGNTATAIDRLEYTYASGNKSNRLLNIVDQQNNPTGYEGGGQEILYDLNGNMTGMPDKGISLIRYNYLNLPDQLNYAKGFETVTVKTKYGSDGNKVQKENTTVVDGISGPTTVKKTTDYLDGFQYLKTESFGLIGMSAETMANLETSRALERQAFSVEPIGELPLASKTRDLQFFPTAEGFYDYLKDQYIYQYKDHLGNIRVSFGRNSAGALEITDSNDYYPFGMNHLKTGFSFFSPASAYKNYKYNGKELQEIGMYDYGWRNYMPDIGRWTRIDPLGEKGHNFSPYNYAINNPIRFIDPDGLWINITDGDNQYRYSNGQTQQQVDGKWKTIDKNVTLSENVLAIVSGLKAIENGGDAGKDLISYFDSDKHTVDIIYDKGNSGDAGEKLTDPIKIDPKKTTKTPTAFGLNDSPFFVSLGHELGHKRDENNYLFSGNWFGVSRGEIFASHIENMIRAENGLLLRSSYSTNPKIFGGLDLQTVLIDCTGNSLYYNQFGKALDNIPIDDRSNAARSVYGTADSSILKRRYNYYDNVKQTKKK